MFDKWKPLLAPVPLAHLAAASVFLPLMVLYRFYWSALGLVLFMALVVVTHVFKPETWEDDLSVACLGAMCALAFHDTGLYFGVFIATSLFLACVMAISAAFRLWKTVRLF